MTLVLRDPALGHWIDPAWQGDGPGTHALVIGVSRYQHFDGGSDPAPGQDPWLRDCRGLGQLQVSALTAWRVFEWLRQDYRFTDAPLVSCHLLLSPQPDELAAVPAMAGAHAAATLAHCELAVRSWAAGMKAMAPAVAAQSRGLMFFSGHGIEVDLEQQLLLPSDYLGPPLPSPDDAIATENIRQGLAMLPLRQVLLFVDACRNATDALRLLDVTGRPTLSTGKAAMTNSLQASAVMYATASNRAAFQPTQTDKGPSMYGAALLEGLRGQQGIELRESKQRREVLLHQLEPFLQRRVGELLRQIPGGDPAAGEQAVSLMGRRTSDLAVAELPPRGIVLMGGGTHAAVRGLPWDQEPKEPDGPAAHDPQAVVAPSGSLPTVALPLDATSAGAWGPFHHAMGSEDITDLWMHGTRLAPLAGMSAGSSLQLIVTRVERAESRLRQRIELSIEAGDAPAVWLEQTGHDGVVWSGLLGLAGAPGQADVPTRLAIDATYRWPEAHETTLLHGPGGGRVRLTQWRARLAFDNPGPVGVAARAWAHLENGRIDLAQHWVLMNLLDAGESLLDRSPLASLVAGAVLLRAGALAAQRPWLTEATRRCPTMPDFAVMLAQAWLDDAAVDADMRLARACGALGALPDQPDFITSDTSTRAIGLIGQLLREDAVPEAAMRDPLARRLAWLRDRRRHFRPGGLFSVFSGLDRGVGTLP